MKATNGKTRPVVEEFGSLNRPVNWLREAYVQDHAPLILAALITRRASTEPEHLVDLAVVTTRMLYDTIMKKD